MYSALLDDRYSLLNDGKNFKQKKVPKPKIMNQIALINLDHIK